MSQRYVNQVRETILLDHLERIVHQSDKISRLLTSDKPDNGTPGALTETDLRRFTSQSTLDESIQQHLVDEMNSSIDSMADFFYGDNENVRRVSGWDLPENIQAHDDHIGANKADLVTRLKRLQILVDEVKEIHPVIQEELEEIMSTFPPVLDARRSARHDLLSATVTTSLLKASLIRAVVHKYLYGHKGQADPSVTMAQALERAYKKLKDDERKLENEERAIDRQLEEYENLLQMVDGKRGAFAQVVEDLTRIRRESEECKKDLRRLGWTPE